MKQKNFFWSLLAMMMLIFSAGLVSCNDEEDEDDNGGSGGTSSSSVLGTWSTRQDGILISFTFKSNGKGTGTIGDSSGPFTYTMKTKTSGTIVIEADDDDYYYYEDSGDVILTFSIESGVMYVYYEGQLCWRLTKSGSSYDDDDPATSSSAVGTWKLTDGTQTISFTFKSNGSGTWYMKVYNDYNQLETYSGSLSYSMSGTSKGSIRIYWDDGETEVLYFKIQGKTMTIYEDSSYSEVAWEMYKQ